MFLGLFLQKMQVVRLSHPLNEHFLSILRDKETPSHIFRRALASISVLLFVNSCKNLPLRRKRIQTPLEETIASFIDCEIVLIPILRAGLAMVEPILSVFPEAKVYHIGVKRDERTLEPMPYYSNIMKSVRGSYAFILDPMLATGGTLIYSLEQVAKYNPAQVFILSVIASPEGISRLSGAVKKSKVPVALVVSSVDRELNAHGYILPGLGDAGDRAFGNK